MKYLHHAPILPYDVEKNMWKNEKHVPTVKVARVAPREDAMKYLRCATILPSDVEKICEKYVKMKNTSRP